jgi:hypothetical protein
MMAESKGVGTGYMKHNEVRPEMQDNLWHHLIADIDLASSWWANYRWIVSSETCRNSAVCHDGNGVAHTATSQLP